VLISLRQVQGNKPPEDALGLEPRSRHSHQCLFEELKYRIYLKGLEMNYLHLACRLSG
jgi:hypothetical protein